VRERQPLLSEISRRRKLALLGKYLEPRSRVLEVGTGDGWFAEKLRALGNFVVTLDLVPPADVVGDIRCWRDLGLDEGSFDAVVALEVIEHVDCMDCLRALCRKDGYILLSSPHPDWDWVMILLERLHLNQRRTSAHSNLTDFQSIDLVPIELRRPLFIHQVALFRNSPRSAVTRFESRTRSRDRPTLSRSS
jgi:2-polyprenyl-3-methyl-5-hydroxy-6-metoxy-1,4-benzoquinol methylase